MIATLQMAEVGPVGTLRSLLQRPKPAAISGLRSAETAVLAPLAMSGPPSVRRAALIAFWDDEAAFDRFLHNDPLGRRFAGGFQARLRPLRAFGAWPGLPVDVPAGRAVQHDGPVIVLTLGRLRLSQTVRFLRTSRPAERAALAHEGLIWGTAAARPPFVATVSMWKDTAAAAGYAYGQQRPAHSDAITEQRRKDFHKQSAFIRFAPLRVEGALSGPDPLAASDVAG